MQHKRRTNKKDENRYKDSMFNQAIASAIIIAAVILLNLIDTEAGVQFKERLRVAINQNMTSDDFKGSTKYITEKFDSIKSSISRNIEEGRENILETGTDMSEQADRIDQNVLNSLFEPEGNDEKK